MVAWNVPSAGKKEPLLNGLPFPPPKAMATGEVRIGTRSVVSNAVAANEDLRRKPERTEDVFIIAY